MPRPDLDVLLPDEPATARRFVGMVLAVFALGLTLHAGFNQLVDPFTLYGSPVDLPRQRSQRAVKADLLAQAAPEALILGSSRVRALDPAHASLSLGAPVFHAGVGGGSVDDWLAFSSRSIELGHPLHTLFVGVDVGSFIWPVNRLDHPAFVPALRRQLPWAGWRWLYTRTSWFSPVLTKASSRLLLSGGPGRALEADWRADGYNPKLRPAGHDFVIQQLLADFSGEDRPRPSHLRDWRTLLDRTQEAGVRVVLFSVPESPEARQVLEAHTPYARIEADAAALVDEATAREHVIHCQIEPLAPQDYVDPVHCSEAAGRRIIDQLVKCAGGVNPKNPRSRGVYPLGAPDAGGVNPPATGEKMDGER